MAAAAAAPASAGPAAPVQPSSGGLRKAAVLLLALGEESSASILKHLPQHLVQRLGAEIAGIGAVAPEEVAATLEEFHATVSASSGTRHGGTQYTRQLLTSAFGREQGEHLFRKLTSSGPTSVAVPDLEILQEIDPQQLIRFLQGEHPQTIALLLAQLKPENAAGLLAALPEVLRGDVAVRISRLEAVSTDVVQTLASRILKRLASFGEVHRRPQQGVKTMADLLNRMEPNMSDEILTDLEGEDQTVADSVRQLLFIFEDLMLLSQDGIREVISRLDKKVLGVALKGTSVELQNYIYAAMSQRGAEMFKEDMQALGPVRVKDVKEAQSQVITLVRQMEKEGVISLRAGNDQYVS